MDVERKKHRVVVCGDSYCSAESSGSRDHFSQILNDSYSYEVLNLARSGMSTVGICFQIRQAIELRPDIIIYNTTMPDRLELVINEGYYTPKGLKNFAYLNPNDQSTGLKCVGDAQAPILSTVWQDIDHLVSKDYIKAIDYYLKYLFDWNLKLETDQWMIEYWHQKILDHGITPLRFVRPTFDFVYDHALANPQANRIFHTNRAVQEQAADLINKLLQDR